MIDLPHGVSSSGRNFFKPTDHHQARRPSSSELLRAAQPTPTPSLASTVYFDTDDRFDPSSQNSATSCARCHSSSNRYHEPDRFQPLANNRSNSSPQSYFDARIEISKCPPHADSGHSNSDLSGGVVSTAPTSVAQSFNTCAQDSQSGYFTGLEDQPKQVRLEDTVTGSGYPDIEDPVDPARILCPKDLRNQRMFFFCVMVSLNIGCAAIALFANQGLFVFTFILFIKSKDFLSVIISAVGLMVRKFHRYFKPLPPVSRQWILTLIPAYSESEEQIVKTIYSLRDNEVEPHRQVMVVLLDGRHRDVRRHMTRVTREFERPYISLKHKRGVLQIKAGFMQDVPVIIIEKVKNSGKKDSLVLCHDLFNHPRHNLPLYTRLLREELWRDILPTLTEGEDFHNFDMVGMRRLRQAGSR